MYTAQDIVCSFAYIQKYGGVPGKSALRRYAKSGNVLLPIA